MVRIETPPSGALAMAVLAQLHAACFPDEPWGAASLAGLLATPGSFARVARADATPAATPFGFVFCRAAADECEILAIGVLATVRSQGIGRRLIVAAEQAAAGFGVAAMFLEVAEDNYAARALYHRCGYRVVGNRPGYYKRQRSVLVDALVLRHVIKR